MVVFGQTCFIGVGLMNSGNLVVFVQKWLYSGKVVVIGQKWLYSGKVFLILQSGCIRATWL